MSAIGVAAAHVACDVRAVSDATVANQETLYAAALRCLEAVLLTRAAKQADSLRVAKCAWAG